MTDTQTEDIVELLKEDHQSARTLLDQLVQARAEHREGLFWSLVPMLVRHEVAEEVVVYPFVRAEAPNGEAEAAARLAEQSQAEAKLAEMETLDPATVEFAAELHGLRQSVLDHAAAEEDRIFPLLGSLESRTERLEMAARYEKAKANAPTHPHPNAPDEPPANKIVGRVAALFDKARDAVRSN